MTIPVEHAPLLYKYINGIIHYKHCRLLAIGGIPNHIHMLIDINQQLALAMMIGELKRSSSMWMKSDGHFPMFNGWSKEYAAFSVSFGHVDVVRDYISNQQIHHANKRFEEEYQRLILKNGLVYYHVE